MYSSRFFQVRCIVRHVVEAQKSGMPCFSCQSLLLSTIVLNDKVFALLPAIYLALVKTEGVSWKPPLARPWP